MRRLPPLNPLRAFEATARHQSVSKAASELNVTHSAVSHQIRALEESLHVRLFQRQGTRLRLSPQGAVLLPSVSAAFENIAEVTARLTRPSMEGELVVSCVPALLSFWLVPRIGSFTDQFPGVRLRLSSSNGSAEVYSPHVDLCIRYGDGSWTDRFVQQLATLQLFPVCSPALINTRPLRDIRDIAQHVILHGDTGREWNRWLAASGATDMLARARQHYLSDAHLAMEAAIHGHGVALGDTITIDQPLAAGRLIVPIDLAVPAIDAFYVVCRNEVKATPIVRAFIEWLEAGIAQARLARPNRKQIKD
jgi:LysR family glycine cleavage system transcriptional activator